MYTIMVVAQIKLNFINSVVRVYRAEEQMLKALMT
jgi:hypothetical protein